MLMSHNDTDLKKAEKGNKLKIVIDKFDIISNFVCVSTCLSYKYMSTTVLGIGDL